MVQELKPVDQAIVGHSVDNIFKTVEEIKPDIITLGYDQKFDDKYIEEKCRKLGLNTQVRRTGAFNGIINSSSKIKEKILENF